jgi:type I restriction enzyme S subunit
MRGNWVTLNTIAEINPPLSKAVESDDTVAFLPMAAVSEDGFLNRVSYRPASEVVKGYTPFQEGDVLLAKITPCMENGKAAIARPLETEFGFGSTEFHVLRAKGDNDPRFLFHAIWNPRFRFEAAKNMTGSGGQKRVPSAFLERYRLVCPAPAEQKRIAAILDQADSIRRKRQQAIRLTDDFLRSVFLDMFGDPVTNPKGWAEVPLEAIVESNKIGLVRASSEFGWDMPVPYVRMDAINASGRFLPGKVQNTKASDAEIREYELKTGDLLFNTRNSRELVGKTAIFRGPRGWVFNNNLMRIRFQPGVSPALMAMQFQFPKVQQEVELRKAGTTSVFALYWKDMRTVPVYNPPLSLHETFATVYESVECVKKMLEQHLSEAEALFQSLQHRAFTGQL